MNQLWLSNIASIFLTKAPVLQDVLLEVQGQKVAGYTQGDVTAWINHCSRNSNPVVLRTAPQGRGQLGVSTYTYVTNCKPRS